ncbi:hypothetical protein OAB88_07020 [Winogradskyella sp.]|jgi:hypothetical protein|nr:hypothetical protein [Winogradskyella sp.]|tara:strand:- start:156 stop:533 length:378 start_codon:yes stop_codon:yes gene_type:complete
MDLNKFIDKYIDKVTGHVKKVSRSRPLKSKEEFFNILKVWRIYNNNSLGASIGDDSFGQSPHIWLSIMGKEYYLNCDSKGYGVNEFYQNRGNDWKLISNAKGLKNKITNSIDGTEIRGFYLYKSI